MEKYYRISRDELERIIEMAANSALSKFSQQIEIAQKAAPVYVPGKGISAKRSKVAHKPRRDQNTCIYRAQICDQAFSGTHYEKLLSAGRAGNIQGQIDYLLEIENSVNKRHRAMSLAIVSRTRFLEGVRRFLELQGLSLDKRVERLYHCSL